MDTEDLVTDIFSDKELDYIKNIKVPVKSFTKESIELGIHAHENTYELYFNGFRTPFYSGAFPSSNKRNDLFEYDIKIAEYGIVGNKFLIAVVCTCWCKYDIEVPMIMLQILSTSIKSINSNAVIACFTSEPVYFSTKAILKKQYKQCFGDFPDKCVSHSDDFINISKRSLNVFGVSYKTDVPIYDDLCERIDFIHV